MVDINKKKANDMNETSLYIFVGNCSLNFENLVLYCL